MNMKQAVKPQLVLEERVSDLSDLSNEELSALESAARIASETQAEPNAQTILTDFAELEDGTLIDLVEDPADSCRTMLAVWKHGETEYLDEFIHGNRVIKPPR